MNDDEGRARDAGVTLADNRAVVRLCESYPDINALPGPVLDGIVQALANHRAAENEACESEMRERAKNLPPSQRLLFIAAADAIAARRGGKP